MSVLYPAAVRVIQTIWCAVSCLYEQWWHSNWLSRGWSPCAPVLSVEAWIWDLLPSRPHRVLAQGNFTSCTCWALFVRAKSDRSMKLTCQVHSFPKSLCVKLSTWTSHVPSLWSATAEWTYLVTAVYFFGRDGRGKGSVCRYKPVVIKSREIIHVSLTSDVLDEESHTATGRTRVILRTVSIFWRLCHSWLSTPVRLTMSLCLNVCLFASDSVLAVVRHFHEIRLLLTWAGTWNFG